MAMATETTIWYLAVEFTSLKSSTPYAQFNTIASVQNCILLKYRMQSKMNVASGRRNPSGAKDIQNENKPNDSHESVN